MELQQLKELILRELPTLIQQDSSLQEWVLTIGRTQFTDQATTNSRFDQMMRIIQQQLAEIQQLREEQNRKWDEQNHKWEENQRQLLAGSGWWIRKLKKSRLSWELGYILIHRKWNLPSRSASLGLIRADTSVCPYSFGILNLGIIW